MKNYRVARIHKQAEPAWGKNRRDDKKLVIGRREWLALPELGLLAVHGKVDTGAYRSSLHAEQVKGFKKHGEEWVRFVTGFSDSQEEWEMECESKVAFRKRVKSSTGEGQERFFVRTIFKTARGLEWPVLLSLADRSEMKFPLLIGRRALSGRFVVDTAGSHLLGSHSELSGKKHKRK